MSKELKRTRATVVITACALIVSIFGFASLNGSVAWFSNNMEVDANGMDISIAAPENFVEKVEYFNISETSLTQLSEGADADADPNQYRFLNDANATVTSLGTYSLINDKMQVLLKITFVEETTVEQIKLTASSAYDYAGKQTIMPQNKNECSMSTVIHFSVYPGSEVDKEEITVENETKEYYVVNGVDRVGQGSFVTPAANVGADPSFENNITIAESISILPKSSESETETSSEKAIYIILDYQRDVAQYVKETLEGSGNSDFFEENANGENVLNFTVCDFSLNITAS